MTKTKRLSPAGYLQFPWKLHRLLDDVAKSGDDKLISWLPGNKAFKVHNREEFAGRVMPKYFSSAKFKTFQRSLNLWGFEVVSTGSDKGAFYHKYFVRGEPELCEKMSRLKIKGNQSTRARFNEFQVQTKESNRTQATMSGISSHIRDRKSPTSTVINPSPFPGQQIQAPMLSLLRMSLIEKQLLLQHAYEQQRRETLLRMSLQTPLLSTLNQQPFSSLPTVTPRTISPTIQPKPDPLHTMALAASIASDTVESS